jgi:hypothetical protein
MVEEDIAMLSKPRNRLESLLELDQERMLSGEELPSFRGLRLTYRRMVPLPVREGSEVLNARQKSRKLPEFTSSGELWWEGRKIGEFRVRREPTAYQLVLNAFENVGWRSEIPRPCEIEAHEIYGVLCRLNRAVKKISFHASLGGERIQWRRQRQSKFN